MQLLIERVIVGEDSLEIRHVIPLGRIVGEPSGPGPEESSRPDDGEDCGPEEMPGNRPICRLRSDGVIAAGLQNLAGVMISGGTAGYPGGYDYGRPGYNPGGLGGPRSGLGVRPGLSLGGFGPGR